MTTDDGQFLVMGITGLVQYDLIGAIKEAFPAFTPITLSTELEAIEAAQQTHRWRFAFLNLGPDAFAKSDLAMLLSTLKTKVILLGDAAEEAADGSPFPVLMRPFSGADVVRLLE